MTTTDKYTDYNKQTKMQECGVCTVSPMTAAEKAELKMRIMLAIAQGNS